MAETRKTNRGFKALLALLATCIILLLFSTAVSAAMLGDVNDDGAINILDVVLVNNYVLGDSTLTTTQKFLADVNRDGTVDIFDLVLIMQMASGMIYEFPVLPAPTLSAPANNTLVSADYVTFQWNAVSGALRYELEVIKVSDGSTFAKENFSANTKTLLGFPNDGSQFRWRVRAGNNDGWGSWSSYRNFANGYAPADQTTPPPAAPAPSSPVVPTASIPSAPTLSSPGANSTVAGNSISFQWNPSTGADKYNLQVVRARDGLVVKDVILDNMTISYQTGFPDDGTAYMWRVRAGSKDGWGPWPNGYYNFTSGSLAAPTLTYPANNANFAATAIRFEWNPVYGANRYQLRITQDEGKVIFREVTFSSVYATFQHYFPNDGSEFQWQVRAGNSLNNVWGEWSKPRTLFNGTPVATPAQLAPVANSMVEMGYSTAAAVYDTVDFSWTPVTDATIYQLEVTRVRDGLVVINNNNITASPSTQAGFDDGEQYKWRVRAGIGTSPNYTWSVWSPYRDFVSYEVLPELPAPLLSSPAEYASASGDQVVFKWSSVVNAVTYELEVIKAVGGTLHHNTTVDAPSISRTVGGGVFLDDGTRFMWRVRAVDGDGPGAWSLFRSFTNGSWWRF